jgi:hypothetical protein
MINSEIGSCEEAKESPTQIAKHISFLKPEIVNLKNHFGRWWIAWLQLTFERN